MPGDQEITTRSGQGRPERRAPTASVILPAAIVAALVTTKRRPGPDDVAVLLRWALWLAVQLAKTGAPLVKAGPDRVAYDFLGREAPGGMKRHGMTARTLTRLRERFLEHLAVTTADASGRYKLRRSADFHAWPLSVAEAVLYRASNRALRVFFGASRVLSKRRADQRAMKVRATARACSKGNGQSAYNFCLGVRELRVLGLLLEVKRPGRAKLVLGPASSNCKSGWRRPARELLLSSPMVPLAKGQIVTREADAATVKEDIHGAGLACAPDTIRPAKLGTKPLALQNAYGVGRRQPCRAQDDEERPGPVQAPDPNEDGSDGAPTETSTVCPVDAAPRVDADPELHHDDAGRLSKASVAHVFEQAGLARPAYRHARALAAVLVTVGTLRRVLRVEHESLHEHAENPGAYLASIARAEGAAMAARDWPGSYFRRKAHAARTLVDPDAARRDGALRTAARLVLTHHADDAAAIGAVGRSLVDAGRVDEGGALVERSAWMAAQAAWRALPAARERWPAFVAAWGDIVARGEVSAFIAREQLSGLALRWRGEGEAVLVGSDESHASLACELVGTALARALARGDGQTWRLVFEGPDGARMGEAIGAPPAPSPGGQGDGKGSGDASGDGSRADSAGGGAGRRDGATGGDRGAYAQAHGGGSRRAGEDHGGEGCRGEGVASAPRGGGGGAGPLGRAPGENAQGGGREVAADPERRGVVSDGTAATTTRGRYKRDEGGRGEGRDAGGRGEGSSGVAGSDARAGGLGSAGVAGSDARAGGLGSAAAVIGGVRDATRAALVARLEAQAKAGSEAAARVLRGMQRTNEEG